LEFWNSSGVKGFELGILQGYNHEKHVSSTGGVRILNGIAQSVNIKQYDKVLMYFNNNTHEYNYLWLIFTHETSKY
jgi:hypothetical protein